MFHQMEDDNAGPAGRCGPESYVTGRKDGLRLVDDDFGINDAFFHHPDCAGGRRCKIQCRASVINYDIDTSLPADGEDRPDWKIRMGCLMCARIHNFTGSGQLPRIPISHPVEGSGEGDSSVATDEQHGQANSDIAKQEPS